MKYRSDINHPRLVLLLVGIAVLLLGATAIGQLRAGRFPAYTDFIIAVSIPLGIYLLLWLIALLMPVTVKADGIKCYNTFGSYREITWSQITAAYPMNIYGLPYACVEANTLHSPLTIPLYLKHMQQFTEYVISRAGASNPLSAFLVEQCKRKD